MVEIIPLFFQSREDLRVPNNGDLKARFHPISPGGFEVLPMVWLASANVSPGAAAIIAAMRLVASDSPVRLCIVFLPSPLLPSSS
jgi:hypothetical protein